MNSSLVRLDARTINHGTGSHNVFMVVRNEASRLPYQLDYHRSLGIDRFCIVDNGSDDGTVEFLLSQPDCHGFQTRESFARANFGMAWINLLGEEFGNGNWCLFVDADELFTYPHSETLSLPELCRFLDENAYEGLSAIMLDMYNRGPIAAADYVPGTPFLTTCPYFDRDYAIRSKKGLQALRDPLVEYQVAGGPRLRKFYPEFIDVGVRKNLKRQTLKYLRRYLPGVSEKSRSEVNAFPPELTKVPLIKGRSGRYWRTNHRSAPVRLPKVRAVLLHFKFFADFHGRALSEASRGEHWNDSSEYIRYVKLLTDQPDTSLYYHGSETYHSSSDLLQLGIMKSSADLESYAASHTREQRPDDATASRMRSAC